MSITLAQLVANIINLGSATVIPLLYACAFLFFVWGVARYFIIGTDPGHKNAQGVASPSDLKKGRQMMQYSILAFVVIFGLWGILNILVNTLNGLASGSTGTTNTTTTNTPTTSNPVPTGP